MQQKAYQPKIVDLSGDGKTPATDRDRELLAEHGIDGLKAMGFYGVIDRLNG